MGRSAAASPVSLGDDNEEGERLPDLRATINPLVVPSSKNNHHQLQITPLEDIIHMVSVNFERLSKHV